MDELLVESVLAAQAGDEDAFQALVRRYQDLAFGSAFARVGDAQLAQDVAQEAFFQAHRDLRSLREPRAFGAWLRRIVAKHADRLLRVKQLPTVPLDLAALTRDDGEDPGRVVEAHELTELVRAEIGRLPARERIVVSLYYVADQPQRDIAAFLELPPSTIKKRLHDARRRLKERMMSQLGDQLREHRPSQDDRFARRVQFLIAVRTGDLIAVRRQLEADPALVETTLAGEEWGRAEMGQPLLPMEFGYTPLHFAANYGMLELAELLLARGADVNATSPSETPLGRAVVMHHEPLVDALLRNAADPNRAALNGITPLHRARMRGHTAIAQRLVAAGANEDLRDTHGRTPRDWQVLDRQAELADEQPESPVLVTGIKVLDALTPLPRGGTIRTTAQGGVGKMVLLAEIVHRFARRRGRAVFVRWHERFYRPEDADAELRETGIDNVASLVLGRMRASARSREATLLEGLELAERLRDEPAGGRDVLLLVDAPPTGELPLATVRARIGVKPGGGSITLVAFDLLLPNTEYARGPIEADAWDTRLAFDRGLARRGIYPALDVLESSSAVHVSEQHAQVARDVRHALQHGSAELIERLQQYQAQPFFVAEPWTARPGEFVPLEEAVAGYRAILNSGH